MLRLSDIKLSVRHKKEELEAKISKIVGEKISSYKIKRRSIDARNKDDILYVYTVEFEYKNEDKLLKRRINNLSKVERKEYIIKASGDKSLTNRPVIVGFGPAGIFACLSLVEAGFKPLVIERGEDVDKRTKTVEKFFEEEILNEESNVSFGEGGAGTFSDGKLNTLVKDEKGRNSFVLETLVRFGASEKILYDFKPHIGTDKLKEVIKNIRTYLISKGAEIRFETCMKEIMVKDSSIVGIKLSDDTIINTKTLLLAIGHSARDTFLMLQDKKVNMEAKNFAIGLRVVHKQELIDRANYGDKFYELLSPANYKLTYTSKEGRGVYSFCMCPGGYVVNASSKKGELVVNGMSYNDRAGKYANSAIIVSVFAKDFELETKRNDALAGMFFQEKLEKLAYQKTSGKMPMQSYEDFINDRISENEISSFDFVKGKTKVSNLNDILPKYISSSIKEAMPEFAKKIKGFDFPDTIFVGIETRTSSPIRILRGKDFQSNIKGLYPMGEGAGYAGGITSAAMDGLKVAEYINSTYKS